MPGRGPCSTIFGEIRIRPGGTAGPLRLLPVTELHGVVQSQDSASMRACSGPCLLSGLHQRWVDPVPCEEPCLHFTGAYAVGPHAVLAAVAAHVGGAAARALGVGDVRQ